MYTAHNNHVKAGVACHGRVTGDKNAMTPQHPIDVADNIRVPVLELYSGDDAGIPKKSLDEMNAVLRKRLMSEPSLIHVYPNTPYALHADCPVSYREKEARNGWAHCIA
ncbi:MAG TPA: dienelactone hydrolase family protein [Burkholderiales bacterium]|nr:dienelactone hydrolase family protein [Burkholderiales bacterium]